MELHTLHVAVEGGIALTALACSVLVVHMALFQTKNRAVQVYAHMLIMNASVDLVYSLVNLTAMPIFFLIDGCFFIATANPYAPRSQFLAYLVCTLQGVLTYVSVIILPIQFIYRYSVINNTPLNTSRLVCCFLLGAVGPVCIGAFVFVTFHGADAHYDNILRNNPFLKDPDQLPVYAVGDSTRSAAMVWHFGLCLLVTGASYVVVGYVYFKTNRKFKEMEGQITDATRKVQRQMERVIFIQALFPVLVLFTPCILLPLASVLKLRFVYMGELISLMMHSTPVFNSCSVVLCVPSYRRVLQRWVLGRGAAPPRSSTGKDSSQADATPVFYM